jgi:hypothetical protein
MSGNFKDLTWMDDGIHVCNINEASGPIFPLILQCLSYRVNQKYFPPKFTDSAAKCLSAYLFCCF